MKKNNLYEFFKINKNASKEEIKKAYRAKAKETHPDKNNNKREEFELVNRYYLILIDDNKRKNYDETGSIDEEIKENQYMHFLCQLFKNLIDTINNFDQDLFTMMKNKIDKNIQEFENNIEKLNKNIEKYNKIKKKIKSKLKNEENIFINIVDQSINDFNNAIKVHESNIKLQKEAFQYLKDNKFSFEVDKQKVQIMISGNFFYSSGTGGF